MFQIAIIFFVSDHLTHTMCTALFRIFYTNLSNIFLIFTNQGRLDGAICEYNEEDKMNYLKVIIITPESL